MLNKETLKNIFWSFAQQFSNQIIGFAITIVLARLLDPFDFGLMGMIYFIVTIGNVLIDSGFSYSLIRTKEADEKDYSTIFYTNILLGICFTLFSIAIAPLVAAFYGQPSLVYIIRVFSITFIITSFSSVQQTYLIKKMKFKTLALISLASSIIGGLVGYVLALNKFGVWSIVWTTISTMGATTLFLWFCSSWKPRRFFDIKLLKKHFNFGYKLTLTNLSDAIFRNAYNIVIGKFYDPNTVGYYSRADSLKKIAVFTIISATNKVTYPLLSSIQDDENEFRKNYITIIRVVSFVVTPFLLMLSVFAEPIILLLLTDKWAPVIPYFQIVCISGLLYPMSSFNVNALSVKGRSDLVLKLEIINKTILVILIAIAVNYSIFVLLSSVIVFSVSEYVIDIYASKKIINYPLKSQLKDYLPILIISLICSALCWQLEIFQKELGLSHWLRLAIGFGSFAFLYLVICHLLKIKSYFVIKSLLTNSIK